MALVWTVIGQESARSTVAYQTEASASTVAALRGSTREGVAVSELEPAVLEGAPNGPERISERVRTGAVGWGARC